MKKYSYRLNKISLCIFDLTLKELMKFNPPCKECLIQSMCITEYEYTVPNNAIFFEIHMKICEKMHNYIKVDKHFKTEFKEYERTNK